MSPWHAIFTFQSVNAGVRSVNLSSQGRFWKRDNFILGSRLEHQLYWGANCCTSELRITVEDIIGGLVRCRVGLGEQGQGNTGLLVAIGVTSGLLFGVIVASVTLVILIKRRRKAQLEEMRNLPQQR